MNYKFTLSLFLTLGCLSLTAQNRTLKGRVLDGNEALPGVVVEVVGEGKATATDLDGYFTFTDLPEKQYEIVMRYFGYSDKYETIDLTLVEPKSLYSFEMATSGGNLDEIVVISTKRLSEAKAINMQKNSVSLVNVIASDGIGKLPDRNAAETVQRIPGVSIERDQGEGRYVAVRGLPAEWNSTTMNGHRLPAAADEGASRATAFDFFPTDIIGYVEVFKALTPDIDGDALGGSVNFITKTAPADFTLNASLGMGYNQLSNKGVYSGSLTVGDRSKNDKWGYILNLSQWNRNWATDNYEARRSGDEGVYRLELRDYTGERQTTGVNTGFEYNASENSKLFVRLNYGKLLDKELHYKRRIRFDKYNPQTQNGRIELQNIVNDLNFDFYGAELGGKHFLNKGTFDWSLGHYRTEFYYGNIPDKKNHSYLSMMYTQDNVAFNPDLFEDRGNGIRAYWDVDGGVLNTGNVFDYLADPTFVDNPKNMKFTNLQLYKVGVKERDNIVVSANYQVESTAGLKWKFGAKFVDKERSAVFADEFYGWSGSGSTPVLENEKGYLVSQPGGSDYLKAMNTSIGNSFGPVLSKEGMKNFYKNHFFNGDLSLLRNDSEILEEGRGLGRNFKVREQHSSVYGMVTYDLTSQLTFLGGLRATHTNTKIDGYAFEKEEGTTKGELKKVSDTKSYLSLLPMLHLKYTMTDNTNLRFAFTRTFTRPDFGYLAPGGTYLAADNQFVGGNPDVNPTYAYNFDLMGEHYFGDLDVISGGVFYKVITDPIFVSAKQGTYNGIEGVEMAQPRNGDNAWLLGVEISGNKKFDFLPGFLSGFGVQANYTFTKSEMKIPSRDGVTTLPRQAKHLFNAQLYYEKGGFNIRAAYNFKGRYITEHGASGLAKDDVYYGDYASLDANITYKINKHFTVFMEANNLLNSKLEYYYGDSNRPLQVEYYGVKGMLGIKWEL
ncbi:TonB-dependent receptor [Myroides profundi]|uniref:TonB-dependent receptor n=1 Tax=Myroides profundi TaxID=480520 RepID=A0AAJ4W5E1_MYRPR|nr:TonB-dependent receptor [Myroides profundi]AJH15216.1 TonB-denpendent receptor [Myroides profundi]SER24350.1 TonB-dependent receptor [Myroides profundi]